MPAWAVMALALAAMGAFLAYLTRGTTLWLDDWTWVAERRAGGPDAFLEPHNGHLSLVPVTVYRLLFATAGFDASWPYRLVVIAGHLTVCALVFVYAARRVGAWAAVLAAGLLLVLGAGWQNLLWPFQIGFLASLAAGVGALVLLDRRDRFGDAGAAVLLAVALASSGLGVPIVAGVAVELALARRWRSLWVVGAPLALYLLWFLAFRDTPRRGSVFEAPTFALDAIAAALSGLVGLSGPALQQDTRAFDWGRPLAVAAIALFAWALRRAGGLSPRVAGLLTVVGVFWLLTGAQRAYISSPASSRYVYVGALFLVLAAVELLRGVSVRRELAAVAAAAFALVAVSNLQTLDEGADFLRLEGAKTRAVLGALDVARPVIAPDQAARPLVSPPIAPAAYFAAADELGRAAVADPPATLATEPEVARRIADAELLRLHGAVLAPAGRAVAAGPAPPPVERAVGGTVAIRAGCATLRRPEVAPGGMAAELDVVVPADGVVVRALGGDVAVRVRRFAAGVSEAPTGTVRAGAAALARFRPDRAEQPWRLRLTADDAVAVCGPGAAGAADGAPGGPD